MLLRHFHTRLCQPGVVCIRVFGSQQWDAECVDVCSPILLLKVQGHRYCRKEATLHLTARSVESYITRPGCCRNSSLVLVNARYLPCLFLALPVLGALLDEGDPRIDFLLLVPL